MYSHCLKDWFIKQKLSKQQIISTDLMSKSKITNFETQIEELFDVVRNKDSKIEKIESLLIDIRVKYSMWLSRQYVQTLYKTWRTRERFLQNTTALKRICNKAGWT
eukprot:UN32684